MTTDEGHPPASARRCSVVRRRARGLSAEPWRRSARMNLPDVEKAPADLEASGAVPVGP